VRGVSEWVYGAQARGKIAKGGLDGDELLSLCMVDSAWAGFFRVTASYEHFKHGRVCRRLFGDVVALKHGRVLHKTTGHYHIALQRNQQMHLLLVIFSEAPNQTRSSP
jgi:hypothetical protein